MFGVLRRRATTELRLLNTALNRALSPEYSTLFTSMFGRLSSSFTASLLFSSTAQCSADWLTSMFGVLRRRATTELCWKLTAHFNPVSPYLSFELTSAPLCNAAFTPSKSPFTHNSTRDMVVSLAIALHR